MSNKKRTHKHDAYPVLSKKKLISKFVKNMINIMTISIVISAVLSLLMGIIIIFLRQQINSTKTLNDSVNILNNLVGVIRTRADYNEKNCTDKHRIVDTRLNDHSKRLNEHDVQLAKLTKDDK